jgi:hypothetical protein
VALLSSAVFGFVRHPESELVTNFKKINKQTHFSEGSVALEKNKIQNKSSAVQPKKITFSKK